MYDTYLLTYLDGPPGPKASLVPGSPGTGTATPGKLPDSTEVPLYGTSAKIGN